MNFSNEIINWIKNLSKNYEIDFFDPMTHLDNCIKEIHYDKEQIILFMKSVVIHQDDPEYENKILKIVNNPIN